jgi:Flp pilus assembly protein TadG
MKLTLAFLVAIALAFASAEAQSPSQAVDIKGTWSGVVKNLQGSSPVTVVITDVAPDGTVTGTHTGTRGLSAIVDGKLRGNTLTYKTQTFYLTYTVTRDQMVGTVAGGRVNSDVILSREE